MVAYPPSKRLIRVRFTGYVQESKIWIPIIFPFCTAACVAVLAYLFSGALGCKSCVFVCFDSSTVSVRLSRSLLIQCGTLTSVSFRSGTHGAATAWAEQL